MGCARRPASPSAPPSDRATARARRGRARAGRASVPSEEERAGRGHPGRRPEAVAEAVAAGTVASSIRRLSCSPYSGVIRLSATARSTRATSCAFRAAVTAWLSFSSVVPSSFATSAGRARWCARWPSATARSSASASAAVMSPAFSAAAMRASAAARTAASSLAVVVPSRFATSAWKADRSASRSAARFTSSCPPVAARAAPVPATSARATAAASAVRRESRLMESSFRSRVVGCLDPTSRP